MIITLRQWSPPTMRYAPDLPARLVDRLVPVHLSGEVTPGRIVAAQVRADGAELEVSLELPDTDPLVASFQRMVGRRVQPLSHAAAPKTYRELDVLLDGLRDGSGDSRPRPGGE